ncbi:MAG: septum formation initiator family protein [Patescibacteria group bacterium]|nr:septum formation initiator family protein [Patescibacteria group bacterium]
MGKKRNAKTMLKDLLIVLLLLGLMVSLVRAIWDNLESLRRVRSLQKETAFLEEQDRQLYSEIEEKQSLEYVEEQARRSLGMVKEGERVFIYPDSEQEEEVPEDRRGTGGLKFWREWLHVFGW